MATFSLKKSYVQHEFDPSLFKGKLSYETALCKFSFTICVDPTHINLTAVIERSLNPWDTFFKLGCQILKQNLINKAGFHMYQKKKKSWIPQFFHAWTSQIKNYWLIVLNFFVNTTAQKKKDFSIKI